MTDDHDLKSLEEKLKKARLSSRKEEAEAPTVSPMGIAMKLGVELVVGVVVGVFLGYYIDSWLDTKPTFLLILAILGFGSGVRNVMKSAAELNKDAG